MAVPRGKWFDSWTHTEAQVRKFAKEKGFKLWVLHEKATGWRAWYAGMELPANHRRRVAQGGLTATKVPL